MSHLAHIVTFKKTLIADGITDPKLQIDLTRSAYVRALISFKCQCPELQERDCKDFYNYILSYWNETSPVAGSLVVAEVLHFFAALSKAMSNIAETETLNIPVVTVAELPEGRKLTEIASYTDLVKALMTEASHKFKHYADVYL